MQTCSSAGSSAQASAPCSNGLGIRAAQTLCGSGQEPGQGPVPGPGEGLLPPYPSHLHHTIVAPTAVTHGAFVMDKSLLASCMTPSSCASNAGQTREVVGRSQHRVRFPCGKKTAKGSSTDSEGRFSSQRGTFLCIERLHHVSDFLPVSRGLAASYRCLGLEAASGTDFSPAWELCASMALKLLALRLLLALLFLLAVQGQEESFLKVQDVPWETGKKRFLLFLR